MASIIAERQQQKTKVRQAHQMVAKQRGRPRVAFPRFRCSSKSTSGRSQEARQTYHDGEDNATRNFLEDLENFEGGQSSHPATHATI